MKRSAVVITDQESVMCAKLCSLFPSRSEIQRSDFPNRKKKGEKKNPSAYSGFLSEIFPLVAVC